MDMMESSNAADAPMVGARDLSAGISGVLGSLHTAGLVTRCESSRGARTRYELTGLGAELITSLTHLNAWAMDHFDLLVAATRAHRGLPPLTEPVPAGRRSPRTATGMTLALFEKRWAFTLLVYIDSAGCSGITPSLLRSQINAAFAALPGSNAVARRLQPGSQQPVLRHLQQAGLVERHRDPADPPHVWYRLSEPGKALALALWQMADGWGVAHDEELFRIVAETSGWFPQASAGG